MTRGSCRSVAVVGLAVLSIPACGRSRVQSNDQQGNARSSSEAPACSEANAASCSEVKARIRDLLAQRDNQVASKDGDATARTNLDLNEQLEKLEVLRQDPVDPAAMASLESKYKQLRVLLKATLERPKDVNTPKMPGSSSAGGTPGALVYDPREIAAVAAVFNKFGPLYITEPADSTPTAEEVVLPMPWSGYWYPFRRTELYEGTDAPLVKFDRLLASRRLPVETISYEKDRGHMAESDSWEGRCPAWAIASVTSPEPLESRTIDGIDFSPSDQKALLTLTHERYPVETFGIRYNGDATTDGLFQNMRPEAFHQLVMRVLVHDHQPLIVNDDAGIEVWNKPIYRMRWSIRRDPDVKQAVLVAAFPFMVRSRSVLDGSPTTEADRAAPSYEYRLYLDPAQKQGDGYKVIAGEWLGASRDVHPHIISVPVANGKLGSANPELNKVLNVAAEVTGQRLPFTP